GDGDFGNGRGEEFRGDDVGHAGDSGGHGEGDARRVIASPDVLAAGGRLTVIVNGCRSGTASSRAFRTIHLTPVRDGVSRGLAHVDRDARPGRYEIRVDCDGRTLTRRAAFTVPGGVQGGLGGSRSTGATPADMAIGGGMVAAAVFGGGAFWLRRRPNKRG
ncbi:hypothetical protein ACWER6_10345, partial [Streptomyces sp. NPDC004009]